METARPEWLRMFPAVSGDSWMVKDCESEQNVFLSVLIDYSHGCPVQRHDLYNSYNFRCSYYPIRQSRAYKNIRKSDLQSNVYFVFTPVEEIAAH